MRARVEARRRRSRWLLILLIAGLLALALAAGGWWAYEFVPGVRFRAQFAWAQVQDAIAPHAEIAPTPAGVSLPPTFAPPSPTVSATPTLEATAVLSPTPGPTATPLPIPTSPPTPFPAPPSAVNLTGFRHEYQLFNNCGPASLAVNLSYWGWQGTQKDTAKILKPNQDDKNVSPREMYDYLLTQGFDAYIRVNGDVATLRRFIAAGYPVLVEKGFTCQGGERCTGWFGHYSVFAGYDDMKQTFVMQDTYRGPNLVMSYADVMQNWRAFNYLYLVVFPAGEEQDAKVRALLGEAADLTLNYQQALARAQREALTLAGQEAAFAWFNVGTNLAYMRDYAGAAAAYDQSRKIGLPYRMLWYQFGLYRSYYQMARYQDIVDLATFAIDATPAPGLEEAYYWRGQAEEALGQRDRAIDDYRTALDRNPTFHLAREALNALGVAP